ncbi:HIT family hydrolase [Ignicoccus islandicus DSM 13165]|uniref:HIT family hydrolase n=2 Tax=Ignicoccus islandicus TaxID=54259 RepID=A0A0U2MA48_9CREN|nr:HIT family hydrolase [Ignicoccus islandicus DSM 13165]
MFHETLALVKVSDECDGCGRCVELCPFNSISILNGKAHQTAPCALCGICEIVCPLNAIELVPLVNVKSFSSITLQRLPDGIMECVFCKIIKGELPARIVYEDEDVIAFLDINPVAPGHTLVVPKKHYKNILDAPEEVVAKVFTVAKKIAEASIKALQAKGVNVLTNAEEVAGQVVMHFHVHVIPRYDKNELKFEYPGYKYKEGEADEVAKRLRKVLNA